MGSVDPTLRDHDAGEPDAAPSLAAVRGLLEMIAAQRSAPEQIARSARLRDSELEAALDAARMLGWIDDTPPVLTPRGARLLRTEVGTQAECVRIVESFGARPQLALRWREELFRRGWHPERIAAWHRRRPAWMLTLSPRTQRALLSLEIRTPDELRTVDPTAFRGQRGVGKVAVRELADFVARGRAANTESTSRRVHRRPHPIVQLAPRPSDPDELARLFARKLVTFELSTRAQRVLDELGAVDFGDLVALEPEEILLERSTGDVTLQEIAELAASRGFRLGTLDDPDTEQSPTAATVSPAYERTAGASSPDPLAQKLATLPLSRRARRVLARLRCITVRDLVPIPMRVLQLTEQCGAATLAELQAIARAAGYELGSPVPSRPKRPRPPKRARERGPSFDSLATVESNAGIEREIETAIAACVSPRTASKVIAWVGLGEPSSPTLEQVAKHHGCTREFVRQCVQRCRARARRLELSLSVLSGIVSGLKRVGAATADEVKAAMIAAGLAGKSVAVEGLLRAAELFGVDQGVTIERDPAGRWVGDPAAISRARVARRLTTRLARTCPCTTLDDAVRRWPDRRSTIDRDSLRALLDGDPNVRWLDREAGWFWIDGVQAGRLLTRIRKVLAVAGTIELAELHAALLRDPRIRAGTPPPAALRLLLAQLGDGTLAPDGRVCRHRGVDPEQVLSGNELSLVATLREHGPVVPLPLARRLLVRAGVNEGSASAMLSTNVLVQPVDPDSCALVGFSRASAAAPANRRATTTRVVATMTVAELAGLAGLSVEALVIRAMKLGDRARERGRA